MVRELNPDDHYDLVVVLVGKNKLAPVFKGLAASPGIEAILFMGNNGALGLDERARYLPGEKLLFGSQAQKEDSRKCSPLCRPRCTARTAKARDDRGELDGQISERTLAIQSLFEAADVPVSLASGIDG